jgi:hypothetical protein
VTLDTGQDAPSGVDEGEDRHHHPSPVVHRSITLKMSAHNTKPDPFIFNGYYTSDEGDFSSGSDGDDGDDGESPVTLPRTSSDSAAGSTSSAIVPVVNHPEPQPLAYNHRRQTPATFSTLPPELLLVIATHLPRLRDLNSLSRTSRRAHQLLTTTLYRRSPYWAIQVSLYTRRVSTFRRVMGTIRSPQQRAAAVPISALVEAAADWDVQWAEALLLSCGAGWRSGPGSSSGSGSRVMTAEERLKWEEISRVFAEAGGPTPPPSPSPSPSPSSPLPEAPGKGGPLTAVLKEAVKGPARRGGRLCPFLMVKLLLQHGARVGKDEGDHVDDYHVLLLLRAGWHPCEIHQEMTGKVCGRRCAG